MKTCANLECSRTDIQARGLCSACYQRFRYQGLLDKVAPTPERVCSYCTKTFTSSHWDTEYCSEQCRYQVRQARARAAKGRRAENCGQCGASLEGKRLDALFCSVKCSNDWRNHHRAVEKRAAVVATR